MPLAHNEDIDQKPDGATDQSRAREEPVGRCASPNGRGRIVSAVPRSGSARFWTLQISGNTRNVVTRPTLSCTKRRITQVCDIVRVDQFLIESN